jgi:hypothetical protein
MPAEKLFKIVIIVFCIIERSLTIQKQSFCKHICNINQAGVKY